MPQIKINLIPSLTRRLISGPSLHIRALKTPITLV
jgi:hypothetical protein